MVAAIRVRAKGENPIFAAIAADLKSANMKNIATTPNNSPLPSNIGTIGNKSVAAALSVNSGSLPKIAVENQTEVMLEIAIGVSALKEKCRNTASCAKTGFSPLILTLVAAIICGAVAIFVPEILGSGVPEINLIFDGGYALEFLFLLFVLKLLATSLCIGFGLFGGVFSPAAMIGTAAGGFVGKFLASVGVVTVPQLLPVAGFAAVTAAVVGAPISVVLVVFELTQSYDFAVAAMLAAVIATFFTSLVFGHSFFDEQLRRRGVDLSRGRSDLELQSQLIVSVVSNDFIALLSDAKTKDAIEKLVKAKKSEGYCIDADNRFLGKYTLPELLSAPKQAKLSECLVTDPVVLNHDASVLQAMEVASNFVGETIPVIQNENNTIVGVVSEADIFDAYLATQSRVRDLELG